MENHIRINTGNWISKKPQAFASSIALLAVLSLFLVTALYWSNLSWSEYLVANGEAVFGRKEYWRLWTTLFAHADLGHLLSNSLLFGIFGYFLMGHFGLLVFPFASFFFGGLVNFFVLREMNAQTDLLGASGVLYWMGAAWITLYYFVERRGPYWKRIFRALGVAVILFVPQTLEPQVSYLSHFLGFVFGVAWATIYYLWNRQKFLRAETWEWRPDPAVVIANSLAEPGSPDPLEYWKENPPAKSDT